MRYFNMLLQLKEFCSEHKCDECPLLDKDTDMCSLHIDIPGDWDVKKIKEVLENGSSEA